MLISGAGDIDDIEHIFAKNGVTSIELDGIGSRCSMCNGLLEERTRDQLKSEIPNKVSDYHNKFYQCAACGKVYWEGGHLSRMRALAKTVESRIGRAAPPPWPHQKVKIG